MSLPKYNLDGKTVWITGHRGLVGSALVRALESRPVKLVTASRDELDLRRQSEVESWLLRVRPQVVIVAAGTVGGIAANERFPAKFIYDNLEITSSTIHGAYLAGVEKLLFLGSTCIYPKHAEQPIKEESLLTGPLEPTNEWYAIAKIAGVKLAAAYRKEYGCDFISAMPTNLYGPNDNFDPETSHVLAALLHKFHTAKISNQESVEIWGTGTPRREFLHVDDLASACIHLLEHYSEPLHINVGTGTDISIGELAEMIAEVVGFRGSLKFNRDKPDGTPRKCTDNSRLRALGWQPKTDLRSGLKQTYDWYVGQEKLFKRHVYA
jgi:GDP-L-fucose synthase